MTTVSKYGLKGDLHLLKIPNGKFGFNFFPLSCRKCFHIFMF